MNLFKRSNFLILAMILSADGAEEGQVDLAVGGQAVIEGVMMRSPDGIAIAVRKPDGGVKKKNKKYKTLTQRYGFLNIPLLRGFINLIEMMIIGMDAINFSANEQIEDTDKKEDDKKAGGGMKILEIFMFLISIILAIGFAAGLFKFLPLFITTYIEGKIQFVSESYFIFNLLDGGIKISIFLLYIFILTLIPSFRKVFEYHGAEHKSIHAYEKKLELNTENANKQTRFHPRCGTSFIIIVFAISIMVYSLIPRPHGLLPNFILRFSLLPLISGISYEFLKISAKHLNNKIVRMIVKPGLLFQKLTTKEPDTPKLEIGLTSLKDAIGVS